MVSFHVSKIRVTIFRDNLTKRNMLEADAEFLTAVFFPKDYT
jgi:hypothetical protein